jgi:hypothetical protein
VDYYYCRVLFASVVVICDVRDMFSGSHVDACNVHPRPRREWVVICFSGLASPEFYLRSFFFPFPASKDLLRRLLLMNASYPSLDPGIARWKYGFLFLFCFPYSLAGTEVVNQ